MSFNLRNRISKYALLALTALILIIGGGVGTYFWQHRQVSAQHREIVQMQKDLTSFKNRDEVLQAKLNSANQTISNDLRGNSYISGAPCQSAQLVLSLEGRTQAAAGNRYQSFSYQNTSKTACTLSGLPGFIAFDQNGNVVPDGPVAADQTGVSEATITLNSANKAYFVLHWRAQGTYPNDRCINTSLIESTPPGNLYPVVLSANLDQLCSPGIEVSVLGTYNDYSSYLQ